MSAHEYDSERPWLRQPLDSDVSYVWFQEYQAQAPGTRSFGLLARLPGCPYTKGQLETVAWEGAWRERVQAWDDHLSKVRVKAIESDARSQARRNRLLAAKLTALADVELDKALDLATRPGGFPFLSPRDMIRVTVDGVKVARLVHGEATENVSTGPDVSRLDVAELRELRKLQRKIA